MGSIEDIQGNILDQIELHLQDHINKMETNLEDRIDFRNVEQGKVVEGQNRQHETTSSNFQITQRA